jgi:hypothetical protein
MALQLSNLLLVPAIDSPTRPHMNGSCQLCRMISAGDCTDTSPVKGLHAAVITYCALPTDRSTAILHNLLIDLVPSPDDAMPILYLLREVLMRRLSPHPWLAKLEGQIPSYIFSREGRRLALSQGKKPVNVQQLAEAVRRGLIAVFRGDLGLVAPNGMLHKRRMIAHPPPSQPRSPTQGHVTRRAPRQTNAWSENRPSQSYILCEQDGPVDIDCLVKTTPPARYLRDRKAEPFNAADYVGLEKSWLDTVLEKEDEYQSEQETLGESLSVQGTNSSQDSSPRKKARVTATSASCSR